LLSIQLCVKYHDNDNVIPISVPIIDATLVNPNIGNFTSCFKKLPYLGLRPYNRKSSTTIDEHPIHEIKIRIENTYLKVSMNI
jgi:hypothetical protein